jgi:anti-sigma B factor antagonist
MRIAVGAPIDGVRLVRLAGELDMATEGSVAEALTWAIEAPGAVKVVIDLADLTFIDATGLSLLVKARRLAHNRGRVLRVRNARGEVDLVLRVTNLADLFGLPGVPMDDPATPPSRLA